MIKTHDIPIILQRTYVKVMMDIIARGLVSASQVDTEIRQELAGFPVNFTFSMKVFPNGAQFIAQVQPDQSLKLLNKINQKPDLSIIFKHVNHAFLVFSFQESTAQAFANDRMIADGDLAYAIRLVRCLNQLEALILPKALAKLAVKAYPKQLKTKAKLQTASQIYLKLAQSYLQRR